jgi:hypothetical protein
MKKKAQTVRNLKVRGQKAATVKGGGGTKAMSNIAGKYNKTADALVQNIRG